MFLATMNKPKGLLHLSFIQRVKVDELKRGLEELHVLLADLPPGFRLLTDLGRLDSMDIGCAKEIGRIMELCERSGAATVVRLVPDPHKDIGLNILYLFHYEHRPRVVTCQNMAEAAAPLSL
jgi:hypothetical protein